MEGPMTYRAALLRLYALQGWMRLPLARDGKPYGPGWFPKTDWRKVAHNPNRRVTLRLARRGTCLACDEPLPSTSTGDHLIPLKEGGPRGVANYLPLCRRHNASKGSRDFLEWWLETGLDAARLDPDAICAYARLYYQNTPEERLDGPASEHLVRVIEVLAIKLPSDEHRAALNRIT